MFAPNIKDFTESYFSAGITLPEGFPLPSSTDQRNLYLSKINEVFPSVVVNKKILQIIRDSKKFGSMKFQGGKRDFYIAPNIDRFAVQFKEGKVQQNLITSSIYERYSPAIKKIVVFAIDRLAKELDWKNTTRLLSCNAIDYHFTRGAEEPLEWHCDSWDTEAKYSFVILLSDPNDNQTGWTGGELLYTAARIFDYVQLDRKERKKIWDLSEATKREVLNDPSYPTWRITPSQNDGILFGNQGMQHKVTSMAPLRDEGSRMILTVFDFGDFS